MVLISIAITDDVDEDAAITESMVRRYCDEHPAGDTRIILTRFADGMALLRFYDDAERKPFDLIFLDVEMPGIDGLETARRLRELDTRTVIVFTTKMAQYATIGYDVDAVGYLVKPLEYPGFALKMRKALNIIATRTGTTIAIKSDDHMHFLDSHEIRYVEVTGHNVLYHTDKGVWRDWGSLKATAEQLGGHDFVASSRYCLVNLAWVDAFEADTVIVDGERLAVSRSRKKPLMQALNAYYSRA
ncbi:LytR/AlgR family response regulator transcription factor [Bifidobacterium oedipodis]|nr:LytTR family DNA-binding domain-containing protein [Bifidobacterium sp. DSM 109957]